MTLIFKDWGNFTMKMLLIIKLPPDLLEAKSTFLNQQAPE
jgi:hypothetical protein